MIPYNSLEDGEFFSTYPLFNSAVHGDVTADDSVTLLDVLRVLKSIIEGTTVNTALADMDGDSDVDLADALLVLKKAING